MNLFITGWAVKKFGPRLALMVQIFVPAIRVATQILGVVAGNRAGIIIFQCTQLITILGGPVGYMYAPLLRLSPRPLQIDADVVSVVWSSTSLPARSSSPKDAPPSLASSRAASCWARPSAT